LVLKNIHALNEWSRKRKVGLCDVCIRIEKTTER